jgi:hypothetical protein
VVTTDLLSRSSPRVDLRGGRRTESLSESIGSGHQKVVFLFCSQLRMWFKAQEKLMFNSRKNEIQAFEVRRVSVPSNPMDLAVPSRPFSKACGVWHQKKCCQFKHS